MLDPYVGKTLTLGLILHVLHHQCFVSTHSLPLWCTILTTDQSTIDLAQSTSMTPFVHGTAMWASTGATIQDTDSLILCQ